VRPAPSPPEPRRDSIALRGASRGLVQFQRAGGRRVNALVPVIPADSIPREGIVPHNRFHHTATGSATGRLRRDKDVISRRKSRDVPSVDSAPESTLATAHRRGAVPHHNGASNADRHAAPSSPSATAGAPWVSRKTKREETLRATQRLAPQVSIIASCSTPRCGCASVSFGREAEVLLARRTRRPTRAQWPLGSACAVDPRHHHPRPAVRDLVLAGPDGDAGAAAGTATTGSTTRRSERGSDRSRAPTGRRRRHLPDDASS
jgi:hypothetical protein